MAALTDRQKQIGTLLDKGKTPKAIGEQLGISENAVYQQRRRIKAALAEKTTPAKTGNGKASNAKTAKTAPAKQGAKPKRQRAARQGPKLSVVPTAPADPLTEVKRRRAEVEATLSEAKAALDSAAKAHEAAQKTFAEAEGKVKPELERLIAVEGLLTGKLKPPRARKPAAQQPAEEAPPAEEATGDATAEAQDQAAEAPDVPTEVPASANGGGEERAGVPTVPEFAQEDAFAS